MVDLDTDLLFPVSQRLLVEGILNAAGLELDTEIMQMSIGYYTGLIHFYADDKRDADDCDKDKWAAVIIVVRGLGYCYYTETGLFE